MRIRYLIVYDVRSTPRRTRLASLLLDYGDRVQFSVFEACLTGAELEELLPEMEKIIAKEDSLFVYALCSACIRKIERRGTPPAAHSDEPMLA